MYFALYTCFSIKSLLANLKIECFCVCLRQICGSYFYMIYMKISDEGLWELCLKGDMRAFRELYCRFYALLRNYGIKLLPDKSLVEDCVQDIFIKLIQNHETLSPTVNVKGYLLKTLRHKLYDTIEKNRKMEDISLYEDTFQTDELFSRISLDTTEADERVKLLMKALTKLSPHQREIIYLYYVNGLGHDEIAEILGINYQSSKNLLSITLSKLRRWFSLDALIMGGIHYVLFPMLT